jgi:TPR repeat protein
MKPVKINKNYQLAITYMQQLRNVDLQLSAVQKKEIYRRYLYFLRKAAYTGSAAAQFELSGHYEDLGFWGIENPFYNPKKKLHWLLKAAAGNHGTACNNLAAMYESGEGGCEIDLDKALALYKRAYALGISYARQNHRLLVKQMKGKQ